MVPCIKYSLIQSISILLFINRITGVDIEGPIGLNITTLSLSGVNLTELAEKLRNDTEVDMILSRTMSEEG